MTEIDGQNHEKVQHPNETIEILIERVHSIETELLDPEFKQRVAHFKKQSRIIREAKERLVITTDEADHHEGVLKADMERRVEIDPLTGFYRKESFLRRLEEMNGLSQRTRMPVTIAFLDLDRFKLINDELSHMHGDAALHQVGAYLRNNLQRVPDVFGRYGGEEFVIALPNTNEEEAKTLLNKAREEMPIIVGEALDEMDMKPPFPNPITASIGIFEIQPRTKMNILDALRKADDRMLIAKKLGRNKVVGTEEEIFHKTKFK